MTNGVEKIRSTARTPDYSGTTSGDWSGPDLEDFGYDSVEDMSQSDKSEVASTSLLGSADAETFSELVFFPVVEPQSGNLNENALRAVISGRGSQANIPQSAINSAQNKARNLLRDEFGMGEEEQEKYKAATLVAKAYDLTKDRALETLDTLTEVEREMKKEELVETVKKVRDGEMEVNDALDKFVDVDKETIKEIKEELDKDKPKEKKEEDKGVEEVIEEKAEKMMEDKEITKSQAMEKVLENSPELYGQYIARGV